MRPVWFVQAFTRERPVSLTTSTIATGHLSRHLGLLRERRNVNNILRTWGTESMTGGLRVSSKYFFDQPYCLSIKVSICLKKKGFLPNFENAQRVARTSVRLPGESALMFLKAPNAPNPRSCPWSAGY